MRFVLRQVEVPILPQGAEALRVLHFSDLHLTPNRIKTVKFIRSWAELKPDLIISTGDHIAHKDAIPILFQALTSLQGIPSFYVFGSNDYFAPIFKNPIQYLLPDRGKRINGPDLPWRELESGFARLGWTKLHEKSVKLVIKNTRLELGGTDDAHLGLDARKLIFESTNEHGLRIGVTHAPYIRVLDQMIQEKVALVFAGHTHGGQIRFPWPGGSRSIVTNCDLPNSNSRGLSQLSTDTFLHVSAGLGENPYFPFRIACPREVTMLNFSAQTGPLTIDKVFP